MRHSRVAVIGAGLAGLAAARALATKNDDVVVLEARDRIGGRCYTKDRIDVGAHWIHGTEGNPITVLARELSINTLFVGGDSSYSGGWNHLAMRGPGGRPLSDEQKQRSMRLVDEVREGLDALRRTQIAERREDLSMREAVSIVCAGLDLSPEDVRLIDWHVLLLARDDCSAGDDTLSLRWWDDGYEVYGYGDSVFLNGYGEIVEALAEGLEIKLRCEVKSIRHRADGPVTIVTSDGEFEADAALVTLPLGVLKAGAVEFDPPLPERKTHAIQRLGFGSLTKVVLRFAAPFWPQNQYAFGVVSGDVRRHPTTVINMWKTHQVPALVMLVGGDFSRELERQSKPEAAKWALGVLRDLFGETIPEPVEVLRSEWSIDPHVLGSYSFLAVGSTPDDIEALAEPVGQRLFFAGEATYRAHWAAAHGAYASGLREAARISGDPSLLPARISTENRRWREMMLRASRFFAELSTSISAQELDERLNVLRESSVFSVVSPNELRVLATMFEAVAFDVGEVICTAGETARCAFLVVEGTVDVRLSDDGVAVSLARGSVVGEYGMFGSGVRTATLVSRGKSKALTLDYQRFQRFLLACPESCMALLKLAIQRQIDKET